MASIKKIFASLGSIARKLLFLIGVTTTLTIATGTVAFANQPGLFGVVEALEKIANAIMSVAIQGPEGPVGPQGTPGPIAEIYVVSKPAPEVVGGFGGSTVFCNEGDVATGGGVSCPVNGSCSSGSAGPFISYAGPVLDSASKPYGWEFAMSNTAVGSTIFRELYVVCAAVSAL